MKLLTDFTCERDWILDDSEWSNFAWMCNVDLEIIKSTLDCLAKKVHDPLLCFEWGSGFSSVHLSTHLRNQNALGTWVSVEYNPDWLKEFLGQLSPSDQPNIIYPTSEIATLALQEGLMIIVYPYGELRPMQYAYRNDRFVVMQDYVKSIYHFNNQFDFVLVDGRKRNQCMFTASKKIKKYGIVFLHDAWRPYYSLSATFFKTALRVGENLLIATQMPLSSLLEIVPADKFGMDKQVIWGS